MNLADYLTQPFAQHALLAAGFVSVICGLIGPFVISRGMAFAVHGTSELSFTGAAAGLLAANNPLAGAFIGSLVVAAVLGALSTRERDRDATIGVVLGFGLGLGVLLLSFYIGFATQATNILFGNIFGVSTDQLLLLVGVSLLVMVVLAVMFRPLLFASVDTDVAAAKGVPVRLLGLIFLFLLAITVTAAAQVIGTLLVLSLAITPAAAASRFVLRPVATTALSVGFALIAGIGGVLASLASGTIKPSVFVTMFSFAIYAVCRLVGRPNSRLHHVPPATGSPAHHD